MKPLPRTPFALAVATLTVATLAGCASSTDAGIFRSSDAGGSYISASTLDLEKSFADASVTALAANPAARTTVYAGLDTRGLVASADGGQTWRATALAQGTPRDIVVDPTSGTVYLAYESQVITTRDGGQTFDTLYSGPGVITALALDPAKPATLYAATNTGELLHSTNSGRTWNIAHSFVGVVTDLLISPLNGALAVVVNGTLQVSSDGATFVDRTPSMLTARGASQAASVSVVAQSAQAGSPLVAVGQSGMFVSKDAGATWATVQEPITPANVALAAVAVAPDNSSQVVIAGGATIAKSDDGGKTWLTRGIATGRTAGTLLIVDAKTILAGVAGQAKSFVQRSLGQ